MAVKNKNQNEKKFKNIDVDGKMAQCRKSLPPQHKDQNWHPQNPYKGTASIVRHL